jgi:hypothetical protein
MGSSSGLGNYFDDSDTASIGGRRPGLDPGPAPRNSGQGTRWHQAARVGPERQPHCRPHRAPQRRAHDRSHASTARCLQDGLGLSSGVTVVGVEGAPASLGLRDRPSRPWQPDSGAEAARVLRPGGWLAVFDGDYATTTVALHPSNPLQAYAAAFVEFSMHDQWLCDGCQGCWTRRASSWCACGATAMPRPGTPATPNDRRPGCRRPGCRRTDRRGHRRGAQGRGPPAHHRRPVLRPHRLRQPGRQAAQLTSPASEQGSRW